MNRYHRSVIYLRFITLQPDHPAFLTESRYFYQYSPFGSAEASSNDPHREADDGGREESTARVHVPGPGEQDSLIRKSAASGDGRPDTVDRLGAEDSDTMRHLLIIHAGRPVPSSSSWIY